MSFEATDRRLGATEVLKLQDPLFAACAGPTFYGRHNRTGQWLLCRIQKQGWFFSCIRKNHKERYTIVWENGTTQSDTSPGNIRSIKKELADEIQKELATAGVLPRFQVTDHRLGPSALKWHEHVFADCQGSTFYGRYRHSGEWLLCRIRSCDCDGTCTVVWEDGSLQTGTHVSDIRKMASELADDVESELEQAQVGQPSPASNHQLPSDDQASSENVSERAIGLVPTYYGMTVWEAAKKGDLEATLALIDRGDASPNDVEILGRKEEQGRTPLYWACFVGNVELVRELLARGGIDADGSAYLAVTSREKADDQRDLMFDPDTGTFSDWVDYPTNNKERQLTTSPAPNRDDTMLIRAMLVAARSSKTHDKSADRIRRCLPTSLYQSASTTAGNDSSECVICLTDQANAIPVPCGHISSCWTCLKKVHRRRDGCPICREPIGAIECMKASSREGTRT